MKFDVSPVFLAMLLATGWSVGCASSEQQGGNQSAPASKKTANSDKEVDDDEDEGDDGSSSDAVVSGDDAAVFAMFCERAAEIAVVKDKLNDYLEKLCSGDEPTALFSSKLVTSAYDGSGDPSLKKVEEWEEDKAAKTTSGFFGVGIEIPISIEDHFNKVGPKGGDAELFKEKTEKNGGGTVEISKVLKEHTKDGKYQVRGWTTEQKVVTESKDIGMKITTHAVARSDQYELEKGKVYLYTTYVTEAKQTIKVLDTFTAGVKLSSGSYLLTVSRVKIDNKGFHPVAMDAVKKIAQTTVKENYNVTKEAK